MYSETDPRTEVEAGNLQESPDTGYERSDISVRAVALWGGILTLTAAVLYLVLWGLFHLFAVERQRADVPPPPPVFTAQPLPPQPRLQTSPSADMARMRAEEDAVLNSYGWVDERAGIARIPVDQAMERTLRQGLPTREGVSPERILPGPSGNPDSSGGRWVAGPRGQDQKSQ